MKNILVDASSAILLARVNLFERLFEVYGVSMTESVYRELSVDDRFGSETFRQWCTLGRFRVVGAIAQRGRQPLHSLGPGERDTIRYYAVGEHDFIIIDDGRGARHCRDNHIPFINGLLFPRVLYWHNAISQDDCNALQDSLISIGRYSGRVIEWARNSTSEALEFAIPAANR